MKLSFHGADRSVTGSCHLLEHAGKRILVDCGLYQGSRELAEENGEPFGFDPKAIDILLLTHAHLDHCGRIPLLVKRGFRGEIIATPATRELARVVLLDAARLQEEEARYRARRRQRMQDSEGGAPLYTVLDALNSMEFFGRKAVYGESLELAPGLHATYYDAGHILGSASIRLEAQTGGGHLSVVFSGDLGNAGRPLLRPPVVPPRADAVVMETTYGDRLHKPVAPSIEELYQVLEETFRRGGNVVIPTFALERAQEILYVLREGVDSGRLPRLMQVFLDSPMAISATAIFQRHPECYNPGIADWFRGGRDPFRMPGLHFTNDTADSMAINRFSGGAVIMAGAGMCTGGRIRHHLKHNLWREQCSVVFVGYAARGTLARSIIDGAQQVRILDEDIRVRAGIHTINGFSAHADRDELLAWQRRVASPLTFLVHGDDQVMQSFAARLQNTRVERPQLGQTFDL
ncbi:MAG: MBL fold metallo-hydrolase [Nevskia sp.]|nr:MBL fold metallo-hydrolase [Nevskia sp.]